MSLFFVIFGLVSGLTLGDFTICDDLLTQCRNDCLEDSNIKSCQICCDVINQSCQKYGKDKNQIANKFNNCIERDSSSLLFSNRLSNKDRESRNNLPKIGENFNFDYGSFTLSSNVIFLDDIDYLSCQDISFTENGNQLKEDSFIKLDYNEITSKIKIGSILIHNRNTYDNLDVNNPCKLIPSVTVTDLNINSDNNGYFLTVNIRFTGFKEFFDDLDIDMANQTLYEMPSHSNIGIKRKESVNGKPDTVEESKPTKYYCMLSINGTRIGKVNPALCEYFKPLNRWLFEQAQSKNPNNVYYGREWKDDHKEKWETLWNAYAEYKGLNTTQRRLWFINININTIVQWVKDTATSVVNIVEDVVSDVAEAIDEVIEDATNVLQELGSTLENLIEDIGNDALGAIGSALEFFEQFIVGDVHVSSNIGIWLDGQTYSYQLSEDASVEHEFNHEYGIKIELQAAGTLTFDTTTTLKAGGVLDITAQYDSIYDLNSLSVTIEAGLGFDQVVSITAETSLTVDFQLIDMDKTFTVWIYIVPVVITIGGRVNLGLEIATNEIILNAHTGIGEYTVKFGFEYDGTDINLIKEENNDLETPFCDISFSPTGDGDSFTIDVTPSLTFTPYIVFYRTVQVDLVIPFELPLSISYPDTCDEGHENDLPYKCANPNLKFSSGNLTVTPRLDIGITEDAGDVLELLGIDPDIIQTQSIPIYHTITVTTASNAEFCTYMNLPILLQYAGCSNINPAKITAPPAPTHSEISIPSGGDTTEGFTIGNGYPFEKTVYILKAHDGVQSDPGYLSCVPEPCKLKFSSAPHLYTGVQFVFYYYTENNADPYSYEIKTLSENEAPNEGQQYLSSTNTGSWVGLTDQNYENGRQIWIFHLLYYTDDDNHFPVFNIEVGGGMINNNKYLSTSYDGQTVGLSETDDNSGRQKWELQPLRLYMNYPKSWVEYWLRPKNDITKYLAGDSTSKLYHIDVDAKSGRTRFTLRQITYNLYQIMLVRGLSDGKYLLYCTSNSACQWKDQTYRTDSNTLFYLKKYYIDNIDYFAITTVNPTYSSTSPTISMNTNGGQTKYYRQTYVGGSNSDYLFYFETLPLYLDYPTENYWYRITVSPEAYTMYTEHYLSASVNSLDVDLQELPGSGSTVCQAWYFEKVNIDDPTIYNIKIHPDCSTTNGNRYLAVWDAATHDYVKVDPSDDGSGRHRFKLKKLGYGADGPLFNILIEPNMYGPNIDNGLRTYFAALQQQPLVSFYTADDGYGRQQWTISTPYY